MQEFCKLHKLPLFKTKSKVFRRKNRKISRKVRLNEEQNVSTERNILERHLSEKRSQRRHRHLRRSSPIKRNVINSSLIKKSKNLGKKPVSKNKKPKHIAKEAKKQVQRKVVTCKTLLAGKRRGGKNKGHKRSKSATVEVNVQSLAEVKLKITSTIQDFLDTRSSRKPSYIVKFREVEKQFGEVIERIKNLKFSGPE